MNAKLLLPDRTVAAVAADSAGPEPLFVPLQILLEAAETLAL
jgi:hypothetical protein